MKLLRQTFAIAADPYLQTKIFWPRYAYTLARDYTIELEHIRISGTLILDRGIIHQKGGKTFLTIFKNYAWDGSSGKIWQGKKIVREDWMPIITEDSDYYSQTLVASLVHDFLYQYLPQIIALSTQKKPRKAADKEFLHILRRMGFKLSRVYYIAVRMFGGVFRSMFGFGRK